MKFKHGFTLSEILITLLIIGFVAALGVPMLGQQKMKRPNQKELGHGVFECFYDNDGILTQFTADSENNREGTTTQVAGGDTCHFDPPAANFFMITAIGSGGDGGLSEDGVYPDYSTRLVTSEPKSISTKGSFRSDLQAAADDPNFKWILDQRADGTINWDYAARQLPITYTLTPKVGKGGDSKFYSAKLAQLINLLGDCRFCTTQIDKCPLKCFDMSFGFGGDSAEWYTLTVPDVRLSSTTSVSYDKESDYSIFKIIENGVTRSAKLWNVPGGKDAQCNTLTGQCEDGKDGIQEDEKKDHVCVGWTCNKGDTKQQKGADTIGTPPNFKDQPGAAAVQAKLEASRDNIECRYEYNILSNVTFGNAGDAGKVVTRVYEKLPAAGLEIYPSATRNFPSWVRLVDGNRIIVTGISENGVTRNESEDQQVLMHEENSGRFPFPEKWLRDARSVAQPLQSYGNPSMPSAIDDLSYTPGAPGSGAYPYIVQQSDASFGKSIGGVPIAGNSDVPIPPENGHCGGDNGPQPEQVPGKDNRWYCRATQGQRGAVIIAW